MDYRASHGEGSGWGEEDDGDRGGSEVRGKREERLFDMSASEITLLFRPGRGGRTGRVRWRKGGERRKERERGGFYNDAMSVCFLQSAGFAF